MVNLPSPGTSRTRATASFRRPVARDSSATAIDSPLLLVGVVRAGTTAGCRRLEGRLGALVDRQWLRLLRLVGVRRALVDLQLAGHGAPEAVVRQHAPDGLLDGDVCPLRHQLLVADGLQAPRIAGVPVPDLRAELVAGQPHLRGVDDHHEVPLVTVGGEGGLVLAPEHVRDLSGEAAEDLATRVDHPPHALLRRSRRRGGGIHKLTRRSRQSYAMLEGDRKSVKRGAMTMRSSMPRPSPGAPQGALSSRETTVI